MEVVLAIRGSLCLKLGKARKRRERVDRPGWRGGLGSEAKRRPPSLREGKLKTPGAKDKDQPAAAGSQPAEQPADIAIENDDDEDDKDDEGGSRGGSEEKNK